MLNNLHDIFFYLVEGLSTFINSDLILSNLGKTLVIKWTILKCERCHVHLDFRHQIQHGIMQSRLFHVSYNHVIISDFATKRFGDRINVTWVGRNFKVELKYLQNNDTGNFSVVSYSPPPLSNARCIIITETQGMYIFISEFCVVT